MKSKFLINNLQSKLTNKAVSKYKSNKKNAYFNK